MGGTLNIFLREGFELTSSDCSSCCDLLSPVTDGSWNFASRAIVSFFMNNFKLFALLCLSLLDFKWGAFVMRKIGHWWDSSWESTKDAPFNWELILPLLLLLEISLEGSLVSFETCFEFVWCLVWYFNGLDSGRFQALSTIPILPTPS